VSTVLLSKWLKKILGPWYFKITIPWKLRAGRNTGVLLIYQMGKVGSKAIEDSISAPSINMPIFHVHVLSDRGIRGGELYKKSMMRNDYEYIRNIVLQKEVLSRKHKLKVISLVREPVARNISAFFQNSVLWDTQYNEASEDSSEIIEEFLAKFDHEKPLIWLDQEINDMLGIDVYAEPFPISCGYHIYSNENIELLLIRQESLNCCFEGALKEFLALEGAQLMDSNRAESKSYAGLYKSFKENLDIPNNYLDHMYSSKYAKHFYSDLEIDEFRARWGRSFRRQEWKID
jgi:hypothetical protein